MVLPRTAFTLIELLVVVGLIGILASLLLVAVGKAKTKAKTIECLGNKRQIALAWLMYAEDHGDVLVPNAPVIGFGNPVLYTAAWAVGRMSWLEDPENTNYAGLTDPNYSKLAPYLGFSPRPFKCPADPFLSPPQRALGWKERVRSIAMNMCMGEWDWGYHRGKPPYPFVVNWQLSDIRDPPPVMAFVLVDQHPDSIRDIVFEVREAEGGLTSWPEWPASYHDGGCTLNFADGHAELKTWRVPQTVQPVRYGNPDGLSAPRTSDLRDQNWLVLRTGRRLGR
jgi:prepilin-type N-terminal cleavage/methylation domain-containing protein/prepilin-type processing-associated H-X9-DG protein